MLRSWLWFVYGTCSKVEIRTVLEIEEDVVHLRRFSLVETFCPQANLDLMPQAGLAPPSLTYP